MLSILPYRNVIIIEQGSRNMTKLEFENIFRQYYPGMYRLARTMLYDAEESKDAVSDVFARLLKGGGMPKGDKTEGYLMTAVRNRCHDMLRQKSVREQAAKLLIINMNQDQSVIPDDDDRLEQLLLCIEGHLPLLTQQIFRLRFMHEMTYEEVAQRTGVSRVTVYNHLSQALQYIRAYFNGQKQ